MSLQRSYYQCSRIEMKTFLPSQYSRVLEIGCGEGGFAAALQNHAEVWGCEPDVSSAKVAASKMHRVLNGFYADVAKDIPDNYFDLVVCNDVIEHMTDHSAFLRDIQTKMQPGAYLLGSIPNVRYYRVLRNLLLHKDWQYEQSGGVLDSTHLRFFTRKSLARALTESGFKVEKVAGINPPRKFKLSIMLLSILLLGTQRDIRFKQFAFLSRLS